MEATTTRRNPGIDLLRWISMFFVICLHILGQAGVLAAAEPGSVKYGVLSLLQILSQCAVDLYGITTGYLMCRKQFRLSRIARLWVMTVFWSVAVSCCFFVFVPESRTISEAVSMFLPILRGRYWFFTAYFVTMLVSPVLNHVINTISRRQYRLLLAAMFLFCGVVPVCSLGNDVMRLQGGNHFAWMIGLYLIGGYLRRESVSEGGPSVSVKKTAWLAGYFGFALAQLAYKLGMELIGLGSWKDLFLTNLSPLVVGEAVCLFRYFETAGKGWKLSGWKQRIMDFVTPGVYAVYVIHVHPKVFWNTDLINAFRAWDDLGLAATLGATAGLAVAVFAGCVLLDGVRRLLFRVTGVDRLTTRIADRTEKTVRRFLAEK